MTVLLSRAVVVVLLFCSSCIVSGHADPAGEGPLSPDAAMAKCAAYEPLYINIGRDLARWQLPDGIPLSLMEKTIAMHTTRNKGQKGFAAGFLNGRAYLLDKPNLKGLGHHATLHFTYMRVLLFLERTFIMPDVDFVVNTLDRPLQLSINASSSDEPVFRFCKTDSHADVLIPIYHFHMKNFDRGLLDRAQHINQLYPWQNKTGKVFGRFHPYARHTHRLDPASPPRLGAGGSSICRSTRLTTMCDVRTHFVEWCKQREDFDVKTHSFVTMLEHAAFKYLVHLDGQGLSSRLDQLLVLNSLVLKEESGYRAFYHHLLKPYQHFVPFWKERPEDILGTLQWAREHDAEAQRIAANGQEVALKYLNMDARACYWYSLLLQLSKLLLYKPGLRVEGRKFMQYYIPVDEYLEAEARLHEAGIAWQAVQEKFTP